MKALISTSLILLFITSCGSSSSKKSYTVTDDNNGTKSPRVKEIITKTADNNKSEETITRYTYNDENLLISEKITKENSNSIIYTYTYNKNKQLETSTSNNGSILTSSNIEYIYGDILYEKTKLPVVDTAIFTGYIRKCTYKHTYILNASNLATSLDKIYETCGDTFGHSENPNYQDSYPTDEDKIYSADLSKHTEQYTYFSQFATAIYNKGLREKVEYYSPDETNASKEPELERTSTYTYEKKPYFYKESSSPMVNLPH